MITAKEKIKEKIGEELRYLSAQDFSKLSGKEKQALKEVITAAGKDYDEWEGQMKAMFPKEIEMKPIKWRDAQ